MDGLTVFVSLIILLLVCIIGLIRAETLSGVFILFLILTFVSYMNIYLFNVDS
jgi:hypothetical protein